MTGAPLFDAKPGAQRSASAWLQRAQAQNAALSLGAGAHGLPAAGTSLSAATASAPGAISGAEARRHLQRRRRCLLRRAARGLGAAAVRVGVRRCAPSAVESLGASLFQDSNDAQPPAVASQARQLRCLSGALQ